MKSISAYSNVNDLSTIGFSIDKMISTGAILFDKVTKSGINNEIILWIGPVLNIIVTIGVFVCGFFMDKYWQKVLCCVIAIMTYQTQGVYIIVFLPYH